MRQVFIYKDAEPNYSLRSVFIHLDELPEAQNKLPAFTHYYCTQKNLLHTYKSYLPKSSGGSVIVSVTVLSDLHKSFFMR